MNALHFYDNLAARRGVCGAMGGDDDWHFYGNPGDAPTVTNYARHIHRCRACLKTLRSRARRTGGKR